MKTGLPEMMVDGLTRDDIKQGQLGDCWFLSSCAAISQQEKSIKKVGTNLQKLSQKWNQFMALKLYVYCFTFVNIVCWLVLLNNTVDLKITISLPLLRWCSNSGVVVSKVV